MKPPINVRTLDVPKFLVLHQALGVHLPQLCLALYQLLFQQHPLLLCPSERHHYAGILPHFRPLSAVPSPCHPSESDNKGYEKQCDEARDQLLPCFFLSQPLFFAYKVIAVGVVHRPFSGLDGLSFFQDALHLLVAPLHHLCVAVPLVERQCFEEIALRLCYVITSERHITRIVVEVGLLCRRGVQVFQVDDEFGEFGVGDTVGRLQLIARLQCDEMVVCDGTGHTFRGVVAL